MTAEAIYLLVEGGAVVLSNAGAAKLLDQKLQEAAVDPFTGRPKEVHAEANSYGGETCTNM